MGYSTVHDLTSGPCIMMCLISSSCSDERKESEGLTNNGTTDSSIITVLVTSNISSSVYRERGRGRGREGERGREREGGREREREREREGERDHSYNSQ